MHPFHDALVSFAERRVINMNIIVTLDDNLAIGNEGKMLVNIPSNVKRIRDLINGKVTVIGRKTFENFPSELLSLTRLNIILSKNKDYKINGGNNIVVNSIEQLRGELLKFKREDIFVLGGKSIFDELLDECNRVYMTRIDYEYTADTFFTDITKESGWKKVFEDEEAVYFDVTYTFEIYEKC